MSRAARPLDRRRAYRALHAPALGKRTRRTNRPLHHFLDRARGQPARGPDRTPAVGVPAPRLRRRPRPALPIGLCAPGLHRARLHVGQPERLPAAVPGGGRRVVRPRRRARPASWSSSMPGRRTVVPSSSTPPGPADTTRTSATRWSPSSTPTTARWPRPVTAASRASRAAGSGP